MRFGVTHGTKPMTMTRPFIKDYEVLEEIGRGKFGIVSRCISRATGEHFAVKVIDKSLVAGDPIDRESLTTEPKVLHLLSLSSSSSSTHVTRLHGAYDSPTHLHLVLDLFPFPSLFSLLHLRHLLPESDARAVAGSLLQAILHCHQNGVVHRDIKPENVLIDPNTKRIKLCDFGSAAVKTAAPMKEVVGTPYYVAPEVLEGSGYGEKVDVWSAGVVLYVMLAGFPPFYGENTVEVFEKVLRGNLRFPASVFAGVSPEVKGLLRRMLCKDVSRRFSAQEALSKCRIS
ncbi:hypothetical protein Cgig2_027579 [Carnegiea gigantea]|uniref:Protein kinase domain-containing protein n=1 Tax=Carnegiea gigantea TaxID=171969 RepID=A0A9Q1Q801_9CARY|nr:hypothetical protein Cgig2_027579 [Carnegiea gigantea]